MTNKSVYPNKSMLWIVLSQSVALFGGGLVFPFYLIFIKDIGANFAEFGIAYGLFTITSSLLHPRIGSISDKYGRKSMLLASTWGTALVFLVFPIVTGIWQVYALQIILGLFGAMQKTSEKALVADFTDGADRGKRIGEYHAWVGLFSGLSVIAGGYLIDLFTLDLIFYTGSVLMFASGFLILKLDEPGLPRSE